MEEKLNYSNEPIIELIEDVDIYKAQEGAAREHQQTVWQALKAEPKAVMWNLEVLTCIIMEGYDIVLVGSLFAQPAFAQRYGTLGTLGGWQIPAQWQSPLGIAPTIGAFFGAFLNGWLIQKWGYRTALLASLILNTAFIFLLFFATNLSMLLAVLILCGLPWGVFASMAPAFASEICSLTLRPYLTVYVNLAWALGQLVAAGVLTGFEARIDEWAYRVPFAIQWIWPVPLMIAIRFCPESPWWLARRGRLDDAERSLERLASHPDPVKTKQTLALILHTNAIEDEVESDSSYIDCFKGFNLKRTEIGCMVFAAQVFSGQPLGGTPVYFFVQAGLSPDNAFKFSVGGLGLASIATIASWFLLSKFGRRILYVGGLGALTGCMLLVGIVSAAQTSSASSYTQASFVLVWLIIYYLTVGPIFYAIISEVSSVRLRKKSVCLSRNAYYIAQVIGNVIEPYMVNPNNAHWQGKTGFFWAGMCFLFFLWSLFRLPETKDRSFEEIDLLFTSGTKAREFSKMKVDPFAVPSEHVKRA